MDTSHQNQKGFTVSLEGHTSTSCKATLYTILFLIKGCVNMQKQKNVIPMCTFNGITTIKKLWGGFYESTGMIVTGNATNFLGKVLYDTTK